MVSIVTKRINGKDYLYLVDSVRDGARVIQRTLKYIGKRRPIPKPEFESMKYSYEEKDWILKGYHDELSYQDHEEMKKASDNYKKYLAGLDKVSKEKEREKFLSKFIANSNAIEGSTLTDKDTYNYLFNDVLPSGHSKKELHMADNLLKAWEYLEGYCKKFPGKRELSVLHELVNKDIEGKETLGKYKEVQNYVGNVLTTSYLFVGERMKKLFAWISRAYKIVNDFEVAFQSHAQLEIIHPFVDGNGRVGRLLINWLLMRKGLMPLAISVKRREGYIQSLENARRGKVEVICKFCFKEYLEQYQFV